MLSKATINRIKLASFPELAYRLGSLYQSIIADGLSCVFRPRYNFELNRDLQFQVTKASLKQITNSYLKSNSYNYFNHRIDNILSLERWRKDYKNGIESPKKFAFLLKKQKFSQIGDIKYVNELSRFHHFPILAVRVVLFYDKEALHVIQQHLLDWVEQNPYLNSINWKSGIEVAIRSINWIYTYRLLDKFGQLPQGLEATFNKVLELHFHFLRKHLSQYSSANNHLVAELMGLVVIGSYFNFKKSDYYLKKYLKMLLDQLEAQVSEDGFSTEQATGYQAEVFDFFLVALSAAGQGGQGVPDWAWQKLVKMVDFLGILRNETGYTIGLGDADNGKLLFPFNDSSFDLYGSILISGSILSRTGSWLGKSEKFDLRNYLIFGEEGYHLFKQLFSKIKSGKAKSQVSKMTKSQLFEQAGYFIFRENNSKLLFDVGPIGMGALAAHGHSDLLSFVLEVNNTPFLVDSGTYQYHSRLKKWRDYFKGARAHNTISINGLDQAESSGRMMWVKKPDIKIKSYKLDGRKIECEAEHNGFVKQSIPVIHNRKIVYDKGTYQYQIYDKLFVQNGVGEESFKCQFYLHFHPNLAKAELIKELLVLKSKEGKTVEISNPLFTQAKLSKGDLEPINGWYSCLFDQKEKAIYLQLDIDYNQTLEFMTNIDFRRAL